MDFDQGLSVLHFGLEPSTYNEKRRPISRGEIGSASYGRRHPKLNFDKLGRARFSWVKYFSKIKHAVRE